MPALSATVARYAESDRSGRLQDSTCASSSVRIGEDASALFGAFLVTVLQQAAMSRADRKEEDRRDFHLYIDEFQNFATEAFATILSEARKYRLSLTVGNRYLDQIDEVTRAAVSGNVGSMIVFQVGVQDAEILAEQLRATSRPKSSSLAPSANSLPDAAAERRRRVDQSSPSGAGPADRSSSFTRSLPSSTRGSLAPLTAIICERQLFEEADGSLRTTGYMPPRPAPCVAVRRWQEFHSNNRAFDELQKRLLSLVKATEKHRMVGIRGRPSLPSS